MLLNPKLKDLINIISLNLADLDYKYFTEGDNKLKNYNKYIK